MTKKEFIDHVLEILNDADTDEGVELIGSDQAEVALYIEKLYPAAWRRAVKLLPRIWFDTKSFSDAMKVVDAPDGTGYVILPDDFFILSSFRMKGWKTSCLLAIEETPSINQKQQNEYLRGTPQRPVCVLRYTTYKHREDTGIHIERMSKALHYYSLPRSSDAKTHVIEQALYIPNVTVMPDELTFDDNLFEPLAYISAGTVLTSFEKTEAAKAIESKVLEMI